MGASASTIRYKDIITYLDFVYEKYYVRDPGLQKFDPVSYFMKNPKQLEALTLFASIQDSVYALSPVKHTSFLPGVNGHTDDLFEIYFLTKYGRNENRLALVHDAWMLSRMFVYDNSGKLEQFDERKPSERNKQVIEINNQDDVDMLMKQKDKVFCKIVYAKGTQQIIIRSDRITSKQLLDYRKLSDSEQHKDALPEQLFNIVTAELSKSSDDEKHSYVRSIVDSIHYAHKLTRGGGGKKRQNRL